MLLINLDMLFINLSWLEYSILNIYGQYYFTIDFKIFYVVIYGLISSVNSTTSTTKIVKKRLNLDI